MKPTLKFITAPLSFWNCETLSINAKWVAITIDSYTENPNGVAMGIRAIQSATNLSAKDVKDALSELKDKGCLQVNIDQDGQKLMKVLLYKDKYVSNGEQFVIGDKPTDSETIDYSYLQEQWNSICNMLPKLERMTPRRKTKTRTALKGAGLSVNDLIKVFRLISTSAFLNGSKTSDWCCTYDWIVKSPDNLTKILEGHYHKDYGERRDYEAILNGGEVNQRKNSTQIIYR